MWTLKTKIKPLAIAPVAMLTSFTASCTVSLLTVEAETVVGTSVKNSFFVSETYKKRFILKWEQNTVTLNKNTRQEYEPEWLPREVFSASLTVSAGSSDFFSAHKN